MAQPIGQTMGPPMGQPNLAGRTAKLALGVSLVVAVVAYVVGLPLWAYIAWFVLALGGIAAISWHHRRRDLTPIERWALEPSGRLTRVPAAVWAALTIALVLTLVPVAIWQTLGLATVALLAMFASRFWAWKVVTDRRP